MAAPEYVTEVCAPAADGRYGWRLCSGMREPEPLPGPEPEPEAETMTPGDAIEAAELIEAETRYRNQLASEMAAEAFERGRQVGYVQAVAEVKAVQHGLVLDAELEARRYGPGGRAHFADPRPSDFPGRAARREPEPELEAG